MTTLATMGDQLIERDDELTRLRALVGSAVRGDGRVVLVVGEAGIGKTAILGAAREVASAAGLTALSARGGKLERDFAYGVVRQLYEPLVYGPTARHREAMGEGAARLATPVFGLSASIEGVREVAASDAAFAANHGLYWLTATIAEREPLLLLVDDAHWADAPTLLFLDYLGRRLEGLPVLAVAGVRSPEGDVARGVLESLLAIPNVESLHPSPLSEEASGALIDRLAESRSGASFRHACHDVTGGNPFLLVELVRALIEEGVPPTDAAAERVRRLAPESISRSVLGRLGTMSRDARALACAVAVLDNDAELRHAAALAQLDLDAAIGAADELTRANILASGRPLRFVHPILRQAVYEDLAHGRRAADHARAARLLDAKRGDPDRAAVHLLATEPTADPWALNRLRAAAQRALSRGAPEAAVALMQRAVAEPPPKGDWAATLLELGHAERLEGNMIAVEHLREALDAAAKPALRSQVARELATSLAMGARVEEAADVLEAEIARATERETALLLEADLFGLSQASDALAARVASRLERACEGILGETPGERLALAAVVFHRTFAAMGNAEQVAALARRALGEGRLMAEATGDHFAFYGPLIALRDTDRHEEARPLLEQAAADARARGSAVAVAATLGTFARLEQLQGNLAQAEAAAREALEPAAASSQARLMLPLALSSLILALVEQGRHEVADDLLAEHGLAMVPPPATTTANPLLAARARLRLAQGRIKDAVADTALWLERQRLRGGLNAVGASSILNPALPFLAFGDRETAATLAEEMVTVAQRWGVPGHTGSCLVVLGLVTGGPDGIELLRRAVDYLERSPRRLEHARALVEWGAALRRNNQRAEARDPLRTGMEIAHRCGAVPLVERAREELRATGARPRKLTFTGLDALTAQERRVAEMAAEGMSNREIAQALFVTRRTIETHLGNAYQKLGIDSRAQLQKALAEARQIPQR